MRGRGCTFWVGALIDPGPGRNPERFGQERDAFLAVDLAANLTETGAKREAIE